MITRHPTAANPSKGWPWIILVAVGMQWPVLETVAYLSSGAADLERVTHRPTRLTGILMPERIPPKPKPPEPLPQSAQVVEVPPTREEPEEVKPIETEFVANRAVRTPRQTRSKVVAPPDEASTPGVVQPKVRSEVQSEKSRSPEETVTSEKKKELSLAPSAEEMPEADVGEAKPESVLYKGRKNSLLLPSTDRKAEIANIQALSGTFTTDDHLPQVADQSSSTVLNANKYRFADFFYRVKDGVRRNWHPNQVYRRRDPTGKLYGVKDRHTIVHVTLDEAGRVHQLVTKKSSGLDFMDDEARKALHRAAPFVNPPSGLVEENGQIRFEFGFFFEISGRARFKWRRL